MATYSELANKEIYGQANPIVEKTLPVSPQIPPTPQGGVSNTPVAKPVSVISTDDAVKKVNTDRADMLKTIQDMQAQLGIIKVEVDKKAKEEADAKLALQNKPIDTTASDLATLGITPAKTPEQIAVENQQKVVDANNKEIADINAKMDAWVVTNNEQTASIIQNLRDQYAARAKQVEDIYMRQEASQTQLGIRLGTQRYGGGTQEGILTSIENTKQTKLSELNVELQGLILQAQQASKANEFKVLSERMSDIQKKRDDATKELQSLQKLSLAKNQEMEAEAQTIKRQSTIASALNKGTSVADILESGQFSVDEINGVVDIILKGQKQSDETSLGAYTDIEGNRIQPFYNKSTGEYREIALGKTTYSEEEKANISLQKSMQLEQFKAGLKTEAETDQIYAGLSSATATAVRAKASQFKSEPQIQNFATVQDGYNFASSIATKTKNPADDQALIYSLAKTLDPGSVVREGEYATAQKYAQSWIKAYGKGVEQAILGTGFLSEEARNNIKKTIEQKYKSTKKTYDNLYSQYTEGINSLTGRDDGKKFLTDYATNQTGKGNVSSADFVEKILSSQGISYQEIINKTPNGQIPVIDNKTGQVGYILPEEFNETIYTRL